MVSDIYEEASQKATNLIEAGHNTLFIVGNNWHEGVLGIVASRIVEKFHKPTLVLNLDEQTKLAKGSGRSIEGFDLFNALNHSRSDMTSFGGHSMAVGLSVQEDNLSKVYANLDKNALEQDIDTISKPTLNITAAIDIKDINKSLFDNLEQLAPFGNDNEYPVFEFKHDSISNVTTMGAENNHLKFRLNSGYNNINVLAFNNGKYSQSVTNSFDVTRVAGHLVLNTWKGKTSIQIMLDDLCCDGPEIIDQRSNVLKKRLF
ncbi:DHHA1 domain-containing protein [Apilactobacillus ozensis]|uniref:DHHA1 domain-containing protein n=1 Tax=Apilactobacillus ozensis TaxID=866801 RepID=UPI0006D0D8C4|nr:DHHA1 domain-containing protein [Apilactobacillus ozensis]